ncbi:MAG: lipoyl-dependent peroxiredoxin [Blastocatellia bacterium]|nr:lipoyl-dependent peroxiredoxin [Blastocatellia bacterium]
MTRYWLPRSRRPILLRAKPPIVAHQFMDRNASVVWEGTLRVGAGTITTESGVPSNTQYSFGGRFREGIGTNPDELIAASLGGCFSMALSNELGISGFHRERIETIATATLEELGLAGLLRTSNSMCARTFRTPLKPVSWRQRSRPKQMSSRASAQYQYLNDRESNP